MTMEPERAPSNTPSGPRMAISDSAESGTIVIIFSQLAATSLLEEARWAPSVTNSSTGSPTMSYTVTS